MKKIKLISEIMSFIQQFNQEFTKSQTLDQVLKWTDWKKKKKEKDLGSVVLHFTVSFSSVAQSCPNLCDPKDCSMPGLPVHHQLSELTQTHVHQVGDAIQPSHPLSCPSPSIFSLSQHQGLFKWVSPLHQVTKIKELQLQHQSFRWIFRTDFL